MSGLHSVQDEIADRCRSEHQELLDGLANKRAWSKEAELGVGNQMVAATHENRTILELVQNARDAIRRGPDDRGSVSVIVGPSSLLIANTGAPFRLHDEAVFDAVTSLGRSEKARDRGSIGEKGVGLKSLLQLSESFSIRSSVDVGAGDAVTSISTEFSRARTARMLLGAYKQLLDPEGEFHEKLTDGVARPETIDACRELLDGLSLGTGENDLIPSHVDVNSIMREAAAGKTPPSPLNVLGDLPRLSLFRYPFVPSDGASQPTPADQLAKRLLDSDESTKNSKVNIGNWLAGWLEGSKDQYRTVVKLDYTDSGWSALLDAVQNPLGEIDSDAMAQFEDYRETPFADDLERYKQDRQEKFWDECTALTPETLILLGQLEHIEFLKLQENDASGRLELEEYREVSIQPDRTQTIDSDATVERQTVAIKEREADSDTGFSSEKEFRLYSRRRESGRFPDTDEETETDEGHDELRLLFERPRPEDDSWAPTAKPLSLYYPIEEARTPFPFVIHAPFQVTFDRQRLKADDPQNHVLLDEIPELVATIAGDLARTQTADSNETSRTYRSWLPWLFLPVTDVAEEIPKFVHEAIQETLDRLQETAIVPVDSNDTLTPTDVLLDPERLEAFEALRANDGDRKAPIAARASITNGQVWRDHAIDAGTIERDRFRTRAAEFGLTAVIDKLFDDETGRGCIDILRDVWGIEPNGSKTAGVDTSWAVSVEHERHALAYFQAISEALQRHDEEESSEDAQKAAQCLGEWRVPLLPAEAHSNARETETGTGHTTHLVRAASRDQIGESPRYQRSERIVFRRTEERESVERRVDQLPTPPKALPVFIVPFDPRWDGLLKQYSRVWGTRELDSPAVFYRRVAAEAGGFSAPPEFDINVLGYLVQLYHQITSARVSDWLVPKPYTQRKFDDVEKLVRGSSFGSTPNDYDTFIERRYSQQIPLPAANGEPKPAEHLVFGSAWADRFYQVAETLATSHTKDPFEPEDNRTRAAQLRRWGHAIEAADEAVPGSRPRLAPPEDDRWSGMLDRIDLQQSESQIWQLNFLIHLGVQIGPHIDWAWLFPGRGKQEPRIDSLSATEAESLAKGELSLDTDTQFSPPTMLLEQYRKITWRSENHPAITAKHSSGCQSDWLDCDPTKWVSDERDVAILTWWYFTELNTIEDHHHAVAYRDAVVLMWPELDDALLDTAWVCDGHHLKKPHDTIPALGLTQIRTTPLWPVRELGTAAADDEQFIDLDTDRLHPATHLITTTDEQAAGAEQYLPRLNRNEITAPIESRITSSEPDDDRLLDAIDAVAIAQKLGAPAISDLTTAQAAVRLDWFLDRRSQSGRVSDENPLRELQSDFSRRANNAPTYGLMRGLVAKTHLKSKLSDKEPQRDWQRRDIWHVGTRIPITHSGSSYSLKIGASAPFNDTLDVRIYAEHLPEYAQDQLESDNVAIVERPRREAADVANVLGRRRDEDTAVDFGIEKRNKAPDLQTARGEDEGGVNQGTINDLRQRLRGKIEYLLAAYLTNYQSRSLEEAYTALSAAIDNKIGIVASNGAGAMRRRSAEWTPPDDSAAGGPQIAIFRDALDEHRNDSNDEIPPYLAAEGLAQVIGEYELRDVFENILFKTKSALNTEYEDKLPTVTRRVSALRERRLDRVIGALTALIETVEPTATVPDDDHSDTDIDAALRALGSATDPEKADTDPHPLLDAWLTCLKMTGLSSTAAAVCIEAAATEDAGDRQALLCTIDDTALPFDLEELADTDTVWRALKNWRVSDAAEQLETYLTAVVQLQTFWGVLADHEDGGEDAIELAVSRARQNDSSPAPLTATSSFIPRPVRLPDELHHRPLVALAYEEDGPVPAALSTAITEWCQDEQTALLESDVVFNDEEIVDLLDDLTAAIAESEDTKQAVQKAFSNYTDGGTTSSRTRVKQRRREQTTKWVANEDEDLEVISSDGLSAAGSPTSGGSPAIGNTHGAGSDHQNAEIDDERGRDGELTCLGRVWRRFRSTSMEQRRRIIDAVETWRSADAWRLQSVASIANSLDNAELDDVSGAEPLLDILRSEELEDGARERAAFIAVFDVADERGPGFDLIDPFGEHTATETGSSDWTPMDMQRVEVKTITADLAANGRIKLTGNEFRMARRPGPGHEGVRTDTVYQYLVRIVALPTDWREETREATVWDINDVVSFAGFDSPEEPLWEKLRGGSFYVNFGTED